jgi:ornithine cyclodeaminase/alanine dehydrogenase-like protein (mu-crystallin family)
MKELIITRHDVEKILTPAVTNDTVEKAFRAHTRGCTQMPAYICGEGFDIAGIKSVNV